MKRVVTWYILGCFILLFEAGLVVMTASYRYSFATILILINLGGFSVLLGLALSSTLFRRKKFLPFICFSISLLSNLSLAFVPIVLLNVLPYTLPSTIAQVLFIAMFLFVPTGFIAGWLSLYLVSRQPNPQTTLNRVAIFMTILWAIAIPALVSGLAIYKHREAIDIDKSVKQIQPIIEHLDEYYTQHEHYPESLEALGIAKNEAYLPWFDYELYYSSDSDSYYLEFALPAGFCNYYCYDSETREWRRD